jgi:hypothetical protein
MQPSQGHKKKIPDLFATAALRPGDANDKAKVLSAAEKRILEADRERVIAHYRQMKALREMRSNAAAQRHSLEE